VFVWSNKAIITAEPRASVRPATAALNVKANYVSIKETAGTVDKLATATQIAHKASTARAFKVPTAEPASRAVVITTAISKELERLARTVPNAQAVYAPAERGPATTVFNSAIPTQTVLMAMSVTPSKAEAEPASSSKVKGTKRSETSAQATRNA